MSDQPGITVVGVAMIVAVGVILTLLLKAIADRPQQSPKSSESA
jgi:hypothetical protein